MIDIAKAAGIMHGKIQRLGLGDDIGSLEKVNVQGEEVQKLDEVATEVFLSALAKSRKVAVVGCEERDDPVSLGQDQAPYVVNMDPIDGSSNIEVAVGIGSIFGIWPRQDNSCLNDNSLLLEGRKQDAAVYIVGYTIYNDVSERTPFMIDHVEEKRQLSFWYTKSFDTFGPNGPFITTSDEIADPQDLTIRVNVNGEERQNCSTNQMIFSVYELVEFLTSFLTLEPGDVIATGTPAGVGSATGFFLKGGDTVQISIDGLGTLENSVLQT